jgi:5-hydroxyisourate hydrolase-like protein (transthyretin family)
MSGPARIGGISIHCVDVARGRVAAGLQIALFRLDPDGPQRIAQGTVGANGLFEHPALSGPEIRTGGFEVVFDVGAFCRASGAELPSPAFLEQVPYRFHIADLAQHYHLPFKFTPWGFSLFRGGA